MSQVAIERVRFDPIKPSFLALKFSGSVRRICCIQLRKNYETWNTEVFIVCTDWIWDEVNKILIVFGCTEKGEIVAWWSCEVWKGESIRERRHYPVLGLKGPMWHLPECNIVKGYTRGSSIDFFVCRKAAVWFYQRWCLAYAPLTRLRRHLPCKSSFHFHAARLPHSTHSIFIHSLPDLSYIIVHTKYPSFHPFLNREYIPKTDKHHIRKLRVITRDWFIITFLTIRRLVTARAIAHSLPNVRQ